MNIDLLLIYYIFVKKTGKATLTIPEYHNIYIV